MCLLGPTGQTYSVGRTAFLSGGESTSSFIQVVGRVQFCMAIGLKSLFPASCGVFSAVGGHSHPLEAGHIPCPLPPSSKPTLMVKYFLHASDFSELGL